MNPLPRPPTSAPDEPALPFPEPYAPPEPLAAPASQASSGTDSTACYWDHCPNCGSPLHNAGCTYRCPRCHYFMSCSDYD